MAKRARVRSPSRRPAAVLSTSTLESGRFDLDAYAPQGIPAVQAAAQQGAGGVLSFVLPRPDAPDLRLKVKTGELQMNARHGART